MEKKYDEKKSNNKSLYLNYIKMIKKYPLLTEEEERENVCNLRLLNNISIVDVKRVNKIKVKSINLSKIFLSCTNDNYKEVIYSLINYFMTKTNKIDKDILSKLYQYKKMSSQLKRALNVDELSKIVDINRNEEILNREDLLIDVKNYLSYCYSYDKLFYSNLRLVVYYACQYCKNDNAIMDFINEGNIGLMRAIDEYDLSYNSKFSTYASNWIMNYIRRYYVDNESYIKIPYYLKINFMKYKKILGNCESKMSREEIKEFLNISDSELKRFEEYDFEFLSLNKPINDDESETYEEFLSSNYDLEENVMADVLKSDIKYLFSKLNSQEIRVISLRYGFELYNGKSGLTLLEIGKIMNLSGERIRIIEKNAMKKMKLTVENKEKGKKLINYLRS